MSDRRLLVALALVAGSAPLGAQTPDEWRARLGAAVTRRIELRQRLDSVAEAIDGQRDTLVVEGVRFRFKGADFDGRDREHLAAGVTGAVAALRGRWGVDGPAMLVGTRLEAWRGRGNRLFRGDVRLVARGVGGQKDLDEGIPSSEVSAFLQRVAGDRLAARYVELQAYRGATLLVEHDDAYWFEAFSHLSLSWTSAARRCATGMVAACEKVAAPFNQYTALDRYFERADYHWLVSIGELPASADSAAHAAKRSCRDGDDSACLSVVGLVRIGDPVGERVRGTIAATAFELGGANAFPRLATAPRGGAVAFLAHVAGVSTDSLVRAWQARMVGAREYATLSSPALYLSSIAWCGICLVGVTRRRPS